MSGSISTARACTRIDLAGGTLDLWPLYLLHPKALTVNVALGIEVEARAETLDGSRVVLEALDLDRRVEADSPDHLEAADELPLLVHLVRHLRPEGGVRLSTRSESPPGAGLGASSSLAVAVIDALDRLRGERRDPEETVRVARDCETRSLGFPAGSQDYYPPLYGGVLALHWEIAATRVERLPVRAADMASRLALAYTGAPHHSGLSNWAVYKARLDGDRKVAEHLEGVAEQARRLRAALVQGDWDGVAGALRSEWEHRRQLGPEVSTPRIDELVEEARAAGAPAAKACGAGGGGSVVFLCEEGRKQEVEEFLGSQDDLRLLPLKTADA